jgi:competence protein ComEA
MKSAKSLAALAAVFALTTIALPAFGAGVVNVNKADGSQLALLPRVGPALAARILEYREANGKFERTEDLMLVQGIGERTMALLTPFVTTSGETTLTSKVSVSEAEEAASKPAPRKEEPRKKEADEKDAEPEGEGKSDG